MKIKHLMIAGCLFTAFTLQSCIKEKDLYQAPPTTYSELNLQLDGDYLSTELPMARATTPTKINESETLVGIAITMTPKEGQNPSSKPYAYGIFQLDKAKDPNNLKIKVIDGYTYRISCSMIANAKDSIIKDEKGFFGAPFDLERSGKIKGECLNKFLTAEQADGIKFLYNIENPRIQTRNGSQDACNRPFIERYHGLNDKVEVTDGMQNHIMLYRRFFGVKFKQTGLEKGRLRIKLEDAPSIYLNANADIHKTVESELKMVSMRNLTANIPTGDNQHLTENVKVEVFWEETPGAEEKTIISSSITFKRNYTHSIALTNIEHIGTPSDIGIEVESGEMGEDIEKVDNTCLTDPHKVYEKGIGDLSDMKYKFKYDNTKAESPYRVLSAAADKGTVLTFQETLPDKTITEFTGQVAVKRTSGGVNGVIEFEATIAVQSIKRTDPA